MAALKKHLKIKDQLEAQVEQELQKVKDVAKRDPTLRIFVKRIEISVYFNFLNPIFVLFRKSFQLFARSLTWKKTFLATSS